MKRTLAIFISVMVIPFFMVSCQTAQDKQNEVTEKKPLITVVTDEGGLGDLSFNDKVLETLEDIQSDEDIDIRFLEAASANEYEKILTESADEGATLTIAVGSNLESAVKNVAQKEPDSNFLVVDSDISAENVASISFADNESAFLAGYVAAKNTKTNKIGLLGGDDRETVDLFWYGYGAGAKAGNSDIELIKKYVGSFYDEEKGYDKAKNMYKNDNVDVIMHVAGPSGVGVIKAAKENNFFAIGADKDQSSLASSNVLCSAVKNMKDGLSDLISDAIKGKLKGEHTLFNMRDGGVDLSDNAGNIKDNDLQKDIKILKKAIKKGDLNVPKTEEEAANFALPDNIKQKLSK